MWTTRYKDAVKGRVLVGVHSGDEGEVERAATVLEGVGRTASTGSMRRVDRAARPLQPGSCLIWAPATEGSSHDLEKGAA